MRRTLDIDPAICPRCEGRLEPIALIRRHEVVERILSHLDLPATAAPVGPAGTLAYEVADVQEWVVGLDPEPPDDVMQQRGPPYDEWADPPCPDA